MRLSDRLSREFPADDKARIDRAFQLVFSRSPTPDEIALAQTLGRDLAHVLLCSNEFVYID